MGTVDLDARRAARAEAQEERHTVILGSQEFALPPEIYIEASMALRRNDVVEFAQELFGGEMEETPGEDESPTMTPVWERFLSARPTINDCWALVDGLSELYAVSRPESSASNGSSETNGDRSRPTSSASTGSTSEPPSSEPSESDSAGS